MKWLELRFPPPLVALIFLIDLGFVAYLYPETSFAFPYHKYVGFGVCFASFIVGIFSIMEFMRVQASVNPRKPELAQTLVTDGIFKYSRNPMYLALLLFIFGAVIYVANFIGLLHPILFVIYMHFFQIKPEERVLLDKFGEDYLSYMTHTRRWI